MLQSRYLVYVFITILVLFTQPFNASAKHMPSKRDCAICHVMWLEEFRADKETLIEWQPGNVLMKDTQGVVSSEDICYSCHDGYVNDSRHIAWKYKNHKTFVKPSENVEISVPFTLSTDGEIYCGTCHTPHATGAAEEGDLSGLSFFLREKNVDSSLCEKCHIKQADSKKNFNHPLHIRKEDWPDELFELGSIKAGDRKKLICQTCHMVHGAKGEKIVITENKSSELCIICHDKQKQLINSKHDLRLTLPDVKNLKQQLPSESGPCGACHVPHDAINKRLWARKLVPGNLSAQMCLTCHGPKNIYNVKQIGQHSHPVNVETSGKNATPSELPLFSKSAARQPGGRIQCFTCHAVHQWDPNSPVNTGGKDIEGDAATSFLRISNSRSSTLCLDCHAGKMQILSSDHNLEITAPEEKNISGYTPKTSGPCGACHIPHNASGNWLWAKEFTGERDLVTQLCTGCHNKNGAAKAKLIGDNDHPVDVTLDRLTAYRTDLPAARNLPLYNSQGRQKANEKLACMTCHEPHIWDPKNPQPVPSYGYENMEGDNTNSFLRRVNAPSSVLCEICHADKARVAGTAHDLNVTAPEAQNLPGQIVIESGSCGACHLVHNSPYKVKLWARPLGRVKKHQGVMDALCTGCHSKRDMAPKKVPLTAWHPREKLIMNTTQLNKKGTDYSPLFDDNGKETDVGNISCPSCHNAHQWSFLVKEKSTDNNPEGRGADRFLRTASKNTLCVYCHGSEAISRYLYFHEPHLRTKPD
jgi:predicted CXXCH cytochrome family protein